MQQWRRWSISGGWWNLTWATSRLLMWMKLFWLKNEKASVGGFGWNELIETWLGCVICNLGECIFTCVEPWGVLHMLHLGWGSWISRNNYKMRQYMGCQDNQLTKWYLLANAKLLNYIWEVPGWNWETKITYIFQEINLAIDCMTNMVPDGKFVVHHIEVPDQPIIQY